MASCPQADRLMPWKDLASPYPVGIRKAVGRRFARDSWNGQVPRV